MSDLHTFRGWLRDRLNRDPEFRARWEAGAGKREEMKRAMREYLETKTCQAHGMPWPCNVGWSEDCNFE